MWKAFDTSTEAGRMLQRLYGAAAGHPNIEYPAVAVQAKAKQAAPFIPAGAKLDAADPRSSQRKRRTAVKVPRRVRDIPEIHAIDCVQRRRHHQAIQEVAADGRMRTEAYRPPATRAVSTAAEKARVQEICQYGGGKALPDEMTHPSGPLPSQLKSRARERKRVAKEWYKRRGDDPPDEPQVSQPDVATQLVDAIAAEIDDREAYLDRLLQLGQGHTQQAREVQHEISIRTRELHKARSRLAR